MSEREIVSLENIGRGAALERFDVELQKVLENVLDPNTKPTATRKVTLWNSRSNPTMSAR